MQRLGRHTDQFISAHPNAGLPNAFGAYEQSPAEMCELIESYMSEELVNIIGGCCGSTPEHIELLAQVAAKYKPRPILQDA